MKHKEEHCVPSAVSTWLCGLALQEARGEGKPLSEELARLKTDWSRELLRLRYGRGLSWPEVRRELEKQGRFWSERHLFRLHRAALLELARQTEADDEN